MRVLQIGWLATLLMLQAPAAAQEAFALAVEGWRTQAGQDGVLYYRCASAICAAGSVVSYKAPAPDRYHDGGL